MPQTMLSSRPSEARAGNCVCSGCEWLLLGDHGVESDEELSGDGDDGDFLAGGAFGDIGVGARESGHGAGGGECGHVEGTADTAASALDGSAAAPVAAV